jgi:type IV secretory pathway TraG/TraD family ATPase VirD4
LNNVITRLRERGEKTVIFDLKGDFLVKFWREGEGDLILNPLDARSVKWSILNDLKNTREAFDLARSFIPSSSGSGAERYFRDAARDVLGCVMAILWCENELSNQKIWSVISQSTKDLLRFLKSHEEGAIGASHIDPDDSEQAAGVKSTLLQYCRVFKELRHIDGDFSLRKWIAQDGPGFLFLPVPPAYRELLAPIHGAGVNLMIRELLNLPDNLDRRRFFVLDELGALQKLSSLVDGFTLGRSKGMSFFLGTQDFGKIDLLYGRQMRETIWNNSITKVMLRVDAPEVAKYLSDQIGQMEVEESHHSHSMGVKDGRDGMSRSRQVQLRSAMLASEIQAIPDLTAVAKIAELDPAYPCKIERKEIEPAGVPAFTEAEIKPEKISEKVNEEEEKPDKGVELPEEKPEEKVENVAPVAPEKVEDMGQNEGQNEGINDEIEETIKPETEPETEDNESEFVDVFDEVGDENKDENKQLDEFDDQGNDQDDGGKDQDNNKIKDAFFTLYSS